MIIEILSFAKRNGVSSTAMFNLVDAYATYKQQEVINALEYTSEGETQMIAAKNLCIRLMYLSNVELKIVEVDNMQYMHPNTPSLDKTLLIPIQWYINDDNSTWSAAVSCERINQLAKTTDGGVFISKQS